MSFNQKSSYSAIVAQGRRLERPIIANVHLIQNQTVRQITEHINQVDFPRALDPLFKMRMHSA